MPGNSAWIDHVKAVRAAQNLTYKEALKVASATYKPAKSATASKKEAASKPAKSTASKKSAKTKAEPLRLTSADTHRCVQLLSHPPKKSQMQKYKNECAQLLERMCFESGTNNGLLDYDARCSKQGAKLKAADVYKGKVCCREISKETIEEKSNRILRIAVKIVEQTTSPREVEKVVEIAKSIDTSKKTTWLGALRQLVGYTYCLLSGIRRPATLIIMTAAIVLVGYGITSAIIADIYNITGHWQIGKSMSGLSGRAAMYATHTELTRAQIVQMRELYDQAKTVVSAAIGATGALTLYGSLPPACGIGAAGAVVGQMVDVDTVAGVAPVVKEHLVKLLMWASRGMGEGFS